MNNGNIDLEKITKTLEVLSSMDNTLQYGRLDAYFIELDDFFRQINFEHANCLKYKERLDSINYDLQTLKRKIFELTNSLKSTQMSYIGVDSNSVDRITSDNRRFKINNNMTKSLIDITNEIKSTPIDPLPIGLAIGITGITGTLGAVVMDNYYANKEEEKKPKDLILESYDDVTFEDDNAYKSNRNNKKQHEVTGGTSVESYRAARMENANRTFSDELVEDNYYSNSEE